MTTQVNASGPVSKPMPQVGIPEDDQKQPSAPVQMVQGGNAPLLDPSMVDALGEAKALGIKPWMVEHRKHLAELPPDIFSNAEPEKAATTHLIWDVTPDFKNKQLVATATYDYVNKLEGNDRLVLDVSNLDIEEVYVNGEKLNYSVIESKMAGRPNALRIQIPSKKGLGTVTIQYRTSKDASGVFWIDEDCTEGKRHPLLYTLFESVEGASGIPGQHSPKVRLTYEVNVHTKSPDLMALSSVSNNPRKRNETGDYNGLKIGRPVPLYLLSLQVGNFSYQPYDERTGIYAEEVMLDEAAKSFSYLPKFMEAAEKVCGPYTWGTYTPILLSWAFPYMAMEHPCASTLGRICQERPTVVPHELAHSWTGNDVTNCNWQQFFWNEGATVFIERKICEQIWGTDHANMEFMYTLKEMEGAMNKYRKEQPDVLRLCQETPDFQFSRIPYGKGALFFCMLEEAMGKEAFGQFFKDYMVVFKSNSMSEERFLNFLKGWLAHEKGVKDFDEFMAEHKIKEWLHGIELPSNAPKITSKLMDTLIEEKMKLLDGNPVKAEEFAKWDQAMKVNFLNLLIGEVTEKHLELLDQELKLSESNMMSIREEWAYLCAAAGYFTEKTKEAIVSYVIDRNSMHKANQIAGELSKTPAGMALIATILEEGTDRLFPVTKGPLQKALKEKKK